MRLLTKEFVRLEGGRLCVDPAGLELLAREAFADVSFFLRASHLQKLRDILDDPEASDNDRFVAYTLLLNQVVAAAGELPTCQDTGTAIAICEKGEDVRTGVDDAEWLSRGIEQTYGERNLRYSMVVPESMLEEKNSGTNLPAQVEIYSRPGQEYNFLFMAKGGGSANKTFLYPRTKALLTEDALTQFIEEHIRDLGTSACPPYHLAIVVGGTSPEANLAAVKKASAGYYDNHPARDCEWEQRVVEIAQRSGIGAQFGGKYLVHDVRVLRFARHAASVFVGMGVSCSADRNITARIDKDGIWLEELEKNPKRFLPAVPPFVAPAVEINLDRGMDHVRAELSKYPVKTRLSLSGTLIVARDIAHARLKALVDSGQPLPQYFKDYPIYYAGPAKTPAGMPSGSFGPTTAGRMDSYVEQFQALGGSLVMIAKGNRSGVVAESCARHGGFYLGSIGGPAAILARDSIKSVEVVDFPELGMEAVRRIRVENFPAFIIVDDKGNDFFN